MIRIFAVAIAITVAGTTAASDRFVAERCRCSFRVPDGWKVVSNPKAHIETLHADLHRRLAPCAFGIRPRKWPRAAFPDDDRDFGEYAITVYVTNQRFRDAARDSFFARVDELREEWNAPDALPDHKPTDWMILGRQASRDDAQWIRSENWFGLRGVATVGYYGKDGSGYRGMDYAYRAVLSNGHWRTAIIMAGNPFTASEFDRVVQSFTFD
jgi:uncharacterized protein YbdZ (MbtH family)